MLTITLYITRAMYNRLFTMQFLLQSAILIGIFYHIIAVKMDICDIKEALVAARNQSKLNGDIKDWLCLAYSDTQDSYDVFNNTYGLFKIDYPTWCDENKIGGKCNQNCSDFLDTDLTNDIECAQLIYNTDRPGTDRDGFAYWELWRDECEGQILPDFSKQCKGIYFPGWQHPN